MHVLITINASWNALNFRLPLIQSLLARGDRVTLLTPSDASVPALEKLGIEHVELQMDTKGLNPISGIRLSRSMHRHFAELCPDVVLSYTIKNNIFGSFAAKRLQIPFIPNVSGLGTAFLSGKLLQVVAEQLYRRAFWKLDAVFFQNNEDRALFVERRLVDSTQARLLPGSGIDLEKFSPSPIPEGPPAFLMIGRLLRDKGVFEFVDAARQIKRSHPDARFQLLGATDAENRSAVTGETVQQWENEEVIEYLGTTDDVRPYIEAATAVVLPSYREGAPRTLIEASAMGRPTIATDVPGCRAVVEDGKTGLLCTARSADSLAEVLQHFLGMPKEAQAAFGQNGRSKMEAEYDHNIVVKAYLDAIYQAQKEYEFHFAARLAKPGGKQ